jgi:hypothetical protein
VLVAVGASAAFPAVDAAANEIGHQVDAGAVVTTRTAGTIVHVCKQKKKNKHYEMTHFWPTVKEKKRKRIKRTRRLTVIAGESVVTFWADAVKRVDAVDAGTAISARAISAVVNVYQSQT